MFGSGVQFQPVAGGSIVAGRSLSARPTVESLDRVAKVLVVLNLVDAVFTLYWIHFGLATELNALLRDLVAENAMGFILVKLALVSLGAFWLLRFRRHRFVSAGLFISLIMYLAVVLHHLRFSGLLLLGFM